MKVVFMGTPDFAVPCLQKLIDNKYDIAAVFTQPDKKTGRKQLLTPPPVKVLAQENSISVYQPASLKTAMPPKLSQVSIPILLSLWHTAKFFRPRCFQFRNTAA